jgi:hypothetical protein
MNTYLIKSKVDLIKSARDDLLKIYGVDYTPFTRKPYFYFFELDGKKFVHKEALRFVYANADTYTKEVSPYYCKLIKEYNPPDICKFLESYNGDALPSLLDSNSKFLVYEYITGDPINSLTQDEFYQLERYHNELELTPFYNSMTYNLARTENSIKIIDLKHFEYKINISFFIYLYNEDHGINQLYVKCNTNLESIVKHLAVDYPVDNATLLTY